ncbi:nuclease-related domain-containing protein [Olsenella sp. An293]|uniref:nuclease-related domain-containing protein n=1 Tax=Olsenella sp. An293 TaxID=1965626 RepID=UPI00130277BC|nr:nuclease-related domain-containing protein [Olsenella sp. An293]
MIEGAYTHDQLLDGMKGFERAALREVFRDEYSESLRVYDLSAHFRDMASRYALCDTEVYGRLSWGLHRLSREISSLVNGARGERYMARALGWLKCENEVLLNVELEHEGERCEYDAIVITPSGIDIVESKFFNYHAEIDSDGFFHDRARSRERSYNVGEKMRAKEHVLFSVIEEASPGAVPRSCVRSVLFVANNNAVVDDRFGLVDVCNSGQICPLIEGRRGEALDRDARSAVADVVEGARQTFLYEPPMDFDQLRSDVADFIVMTERASARSEAAAERAIEVDSPVRDGPAIDKGGTIPEIARDAVAILLYALGAGAAGYGIYRLTRQAA